VQTATADIALVREAGGLGDVIRIDAVARAFKRRDPSAHVSVYTLPQYAEVVERLGSVDEFRPVWMQSLRIRRARSAPWQSAHYLTRTLRQSHTKLVDLFCPAFVYEQRADPVVLDRSEVFCIQAGIELEEGEDIAPRWVVQEGDLDGMPSPGPNAIGLAIRATDPARTIQTKHAMQLAKWLIWKGYEPWVIDDRDPHFEQEGVCRLTGFSISQVGAWLPLLKGLIAVDSGILHLAGALDVPTIGLFGPTDPDVMIKHYPNHTALRAADFNERQDSPCGEPCWFKPSRGWQPTFCRDQGCFWLNRIDPQEIVKEVESRWPCE
jgi:ADP-heptose:LPS heptosyltransferase